MFRKIGLSKDNIASLNSRSEYLMPGNERSLVFSQDVMDYLVANRQNKSWDKESGGQLFAKITPHEIFVVEATGPRMTDLRTRTSYKPDRHLEQVEINEHFQKKLSFVGDWHSHPEKNPSPSFTDSQSMTECFRKSKHSLTSFILVIIGTEKLWSNVFIGTYNKNGFVAALQSSNKFAKL